MNGGAAILDGEAAAGGEIDLVERARSGDAAALDGLARRHRQHAYLFALQLLGDPDDALDVAQDAMVRFLGTLGRFEAGRPVRPWLLAIVRNRVRDLWRRRKVRRSEPLDGEDRLAERIADPRADPRRDAARGELRRRLWRELAALAPALREILVLRDYHDLTYAEIAAVLEVPRGTVMSRLHRARRALRDRLLAGGGIEAWKGAADG